MLVHGLWDTPRVFHRLIQRIDQPDRPLLAPHLPHGLGVVPLRELARRLDQHILQQFGRDTAIDLLGFSMGGVIGRIWLQELGGAARTARFFSVGSPQNGTLAALPVPRRLLAGVADMKPASDLLLQLNRQVGGLAPVTCRSYFCRWDLMVSPGWMAVLPSGTQTELPVWTHQQLISHPQALQRLAQDLGA
ncbi:alpha/beta hydrolase fold family protein [Synechococcus sp. A15-28]|nr:alpha/beta hydrolase fold family protein [Synechococcus sp. A15-28]